jgi:type II secretion system protein I
MIRLKSNRSLQRSAHSRLGLTLLEIILSLAIFFGALAILSQLGWNGTRAGLRARLRTQAIIRCEAKLAEVLSGAETLTPKSRVPFPDNSAWNYSVSISETQFPDLLQVDVTVAHSGGSQLANADFTLRRWMRDPSLFMDAAIKKKEAESTTSQSNTSQSK